MKSLRPFIYRLLPGVFFAAFFFILAIPCFAVTYTFQWEANDPIENIVHYRLYWGETPGVFDNLVDGDGTPDQIAHSPGLDTYTYQKTFSDPVPILFFAVTAVNADGFESDYSLEVDTAAPQITSSPTLVSLTDTNATISWTTDKPGTSIVEYGTTASYGSTAPLPPATDHLTSHTVAISGLTPATEYHFRVSSVNSQGIGPDNSAVDYNPSVDATFTTLSGGQTDTTAPVITNVPAAIDATDTTATIFWTTDELSDSVVDYGPTDSYGSTETDGTDVVSHSVTLTGLDPESTYHCRVSSTDASDNGPTSSADFTFTTEPAADTTMPVITAAPTVTSITDTTAVIEWTTDEPANSIVEFGDTTYTRSRSLEDYVINHSVTITLLDPETLYHYRVGSTDEAGNGPRYSPDDTFTTEPEVDTTAPVITTTPTAIGVTDTTATIIWETDENSNSQVRYDTSSQTWANLSTVVNKAESVTSHNVTITNLTENQTYYFRVGSTDTYNNGPDPAYGLDNNPTNTALSFTTQADTTAPTIISSPTVTSITDTTATISWTTDEPSNSIIRYDTTSRTWATYAGNRNDPAMVTNHSVVLTGLTDQQTYYFRVGSTDLLNNGPDPAFTGDNNPTNTELNFTTLADQTPPTITVPPTVTGISNATATITWSTDEPSNSLVQYIAGSSLTWDGAGNSSANDGAMVTDHSVTLTNLTGSTTYTLRVGSTDVEQNGPITSNEVGFTTDPDPDVTEPQFTSPPTATGKTHNSAIIVWETDEPSNSQVKYGTSSQAWNDYPDSENDAGMVTFHSVTLTGLAGDTEYFFRAGSTDNANNGPATSGEFSFTTNATPDTTAPQIISPPTVTIKTNETATIAWTTNEESNSVVQYDTDSNAWGAYTQAQSNANMVVNHTVTLTNLNGDTLYYFRVGSTDASGNGPTSSTEVSFTTDPDPDVIPPQFTAPPTVTTVDNDSAVIAWFTDEPSNSQVQYGTSTAEWGGFDFSENDGELVTAHTVTLVGLSGDTLYYLRVGSTDAAGNGPASSSEITFRTDPDPDMEAPRITTPPTVTDKSLDSATIEWETDEPSTSEVRYDEGSLGWIAYGYVENDSDMVTSHSVTITGLSQFQDCDAGGCTFYFMVGSTDAAGNGPDPADTDNNNPFAEETFITDMAADEEAPRIIAGPSVTAVDAGSAIIEWQTDEPSNSIVRFGETVSTWANYSDSEDDAVLRTHHSVTLTGLTGSTAYYYRVGSTDAAGNGPELNQDATNPSSESTFTTAVDLDTTAPVITDVTVAWVTNSTALITWTTDEPGNSQVRYDVSTGTWNTYAIFENDVDMVLNHSVTLANLQPDTPYYFMVGSTDAKGNGPTPSAEVNFTTDDGPDVSAPQISNMAVQALSGTTVLVTWITDEPGNSQVRYGTGSAVWQDYPFSENDGGLTMQHSVTLTGLSPSTLYYVRASSTDASGNNFETSGSDVNPSIERLTTTGEADPPSIIVYPDAQHPTKYPVANAAADYIEITYDELNMQNAEGEAYYLITPSMNFANPGNSIELESSIGETSTYRLSYDDVTAYTIYTLTLTQDITDADGYYVEPATVKINDNDGDDLPDDWETENGLDATSTNTSAGEGKTGDFDSDGYTNYEEFISNTDPDDDTDFPSPPDLLDSVPHHRAGIDDAFRVPSNASFGVYISNSAGIDTTDNNSVVLEVDDTVNTSYEVNLGDASVVRIIKMDASDPDTAVTAFWFVYDRSLDTNGDFPFDASVEITATVSNVDGHIATADYRFRVETEAEHNSAPTDPSIPDYSTVDVADPDLTDPDHTYNAGYQVDSGIMQGAKVLYNDAEPIIPVLAPTDGIPDFLPSANVNELGDLLNVQPPAIFSTPVKLIIPTQGVSAATVQIYIYNGEWVLASDTDGSSGLPGWMVAGSRVNSASGIQLKVYHFSGVHAAVVTNTGGGGGGGGDDDDDPEDDVEDCFIRSVIFE